MYLGEFADESEFAGYVDSGIFEIELWLRNRHEGLVRLMRHLSLLDRDEP